MTSVVDYQFEVYKIRKFLNKSEGYFEIFETEERGGDNNWAHFYKIKWSKVDVIKICFEKIIFRKINSIFDIEK